MKTNIQFKNLVELTRFFSDETNCVKHLEQLRWKWQRACPHCGGLKTYQCKGLGKYKCGEKGCLNRFSVTTGTFFENTKIPLSKWFVAMYLCYNHKRSVSSHQLARDLGISQKSAWFVLHRIRALVNDNAPQMLLNNMVEADETYVGGKEKNKHFNKRIPLQGKWGENHSPVEGKRVIVGVVERKGRVIAKHIPNNKKENIEPFIKQNVKEGTRVITDEHYAYGNLHQTYIHNTINHSLKVYVVGDIHTNTIENFWSVLKRCIYGTYIQVSEKHIQKYLNEVSFRFSARENTNQERFDNALSQCDGRLLWKNLVSGEPKNNGVSVK